VIKESQTKRRRGRPSVPVQRTDVLAAAREVFAETGYKGASMSSVALSCGVTKAAIYNHYVSKEALYFAVLEEIVSSLAGMIDEVSGGTGGYLSGLDALGEGVVRYFGSRPDAARLILREFLDNGPFQSGPMRPVFQQVLDGIVSLLQEGMLLGEISKQDPKQLAGSVIGLHLSWFAAKPMTEVLIGGDPFSELEIDRRVTSVQRQVRSLCKDE
jgi:TetR/AcrR family transcriptional regulator